MGTDFVPGKRDQRYRWYKNLSGTVVAEAVDGVTTKMDATDTAQEITDAARILEQQTEDAALQVLRAKVKNWKTLSGWSASGSEQVLQLSGSGSTLDPASYKTSLKAALVPGGVSVGFTKKGVTAVNVYSRLSGSAGWQKIGMSTEAPFIDHTPLKQTGVPEKREYMGRGLLHDEEIGQDSDTVGITFAG